MIGPGPGRLVVLGLRSQDSGGTRVHWIGLPYGLRLPYYQVARGLASGVGDGNRDRGPVGGGVLKVELS